MISRSLAAANSIMPPRANSRQREDLGLPRVGAACSRSASAADGDGGLRRRTRRRVQRALGRSAAAPRRPARRSWPGGTAPARRRRPRRPAVITLRAALAAAMHDRPARRRGRAARRTAGPRGGARRGTNASTSTPDAGGTEQDQHRRQRGVVQVGAAGSWSVTCRPVARRRSVAAQRARWTDRGCGSRRVVQDQRDRRVDHVEHRLRVEAEDRMQRDRAARPRRASRSDRSLRIGSMSGFSSGFERALRGALDHPAARNAAARMMPTVATMATVLFAVNVPISTRNSLTNGSCRAGRARPDRR